jgi:hypothetical protein
MTPIRFERVGAKRAKASHRGIQMPGRSYRKYVPIWLLLGISAIEAPTIARAEVHVEGPASAVRVTTDKEAIPGVLSAFEAPFKLRHRTSVPLDGTVSSVYSGPLKHVISRLLDGYDYVIAHDQGTIDLVIWGKRGEAATPVQKPVTAPGPQAVSGPGRVRDAAVDARTYSTCMALFNNAADCAEMMKRLSRPAR